MGECVVFEELSTLLADLQRDFPDWSEPRIISQLRCAIPDYAHGIWRVALPFSGGQCTLPIDYQERFMALKQRAVAEAQLDLGHVMTSIDVKQSVDIIRDAFASWAGDLGTHVLANFANQAEVRVGASDSLASLADLHGDIDGDNIARHMPPGKPAAAITAYYQGDELLMGGVTVHRRYHSFARDLGLLDEHDQFKADLWEGRHILHGRTREFIAFDEIDLDGRHPLQLLNDLLDPQQRAQVEQLLETALDQFLAIIAAGVVEEQTKRSI